MFYERIIEAALATPWAILPEKLQVIEAFLARKGKGEEVPEAEIAAAVASKKASGGARRGKVALVSLYGVMSQRSSWMSEYSGGCSTELVGKKLDEASADDDVDAIVMDIDSPGGSVYGVEELALKVQSAAKTKKVIASVNSVAASAAYWVASNCSEICVTPGGEVGSIGVYFMHVEQSKALEQAGVKVTPISAGRLKVAGNKYEPLSDDGKAQLQKGVDDNYDQFVRAVARGRGVSLAKVKEEFGQGGMVRAQEAVKIGMADKVATLDEVLARYGAILAPGGSKAETPAAQSQAHPALNIRRRRLSL